MKKTIRELIQTVLFALVLAFLITSMIKPTLVKGESMLPTIQPNHYLIINKMPYVTGEPQRGEIVVFRSTIHTEGGEEKNLIKRIIGIPGDRLSIHDGIVYLNGVALEERYLNGGTTPGELDEIVVEDHHVFVIGDNRADSIDSRDVTIGQIPYEEIMGRADLRLYPFGEMGPISKK